MKILKLTPEQAVRFADGRRNLNWVLDKVKLHTLEGEALDTMKVMERAVQDLEAVSLTLGR